MRLFKNIPYKLETVVLDDNGKYVSGLSVNYEVKKCSDNSIVSSGVMSEINFVYTKEITLTEIGEYRVKYTTPIDYEDGFENLIVDDYDNYKANVSSLALESTVAKDATVAKDSTVAKEATLIDKSSQASVDAIKSDTESILTTLSTLVVDIWGYTTRTLTSFGTLIDDISLSVWSYTTRTITAGGITTAEIWTYLTRTLTSGTKDSEIDAIKAKTDLINWTDITAIKDKTDTIDWANVLAIKTKTDTINWVDIDSIITKSDTIITKTDTINWSNISAIKTKTDTILWSDIIAIKTEEDLIKTETDKIKKVLGLVQENFVLTDLTYDGTNLISAKIKIYTDSTLNTLITQYQMTAVFDSEGKCTNYQVKEA